MSALEINAETLSSPTGLLFALQDESNLCTCHVSTCDPCVCSALATDDDDGLSGAGGSASSPSSIIDVSKVKEDPADTGSFFDFSSLFDLNIFGGDDDGMDAASADGSQATHRMMAPTPSPGDEPRIVWN